MLHPSYRRLAGFAVVVLALTGAAACGDDSSSSTGPPETTEAEAPSAAPDSVQDQLAAGPVTVVALGDSLTYGEGDEEGRGGFVGRLTEAISGEPGRTNSTLENLGVSGWDSNGLVNGQDGGPAQLPQAVEAVRGVAESGAAVLATVLIGSNDLWYLYDYYPEETTPASAEDAALETYRTNLDRTVSELQDAGAFVVIGLPDDQALRTGVSDLARVNATLPDVTAEEVEQMSVLAERMDRTAEEVAAEHGALTVDTNGSFWSDPSMMADDGLHPNEDGYATLAALWLEVIEPAL